MTFTQKDRFFWESYFNERGVTLDESKMSERSNISLSQYSYLFRDVNKNLNFQESDIIADVGCAGGYMSILFSSLVKHVYAYDIAKENINYCKKEHNINNIDFLNRYIENDGNLYINKMFLGAVFQYFSKEQLVNFSNAIKNEKLFPMLKKIYISHIPDLKKQDSWLEGYKYFIADKKKLDEVRYNQKNYNTWYEFDYLKSLFEDKYEVSYCEIDKHISQHKYCFDLLLVRK